MTECYSPRPQKKYTMGVKKSKGLKKYCLGIGDKDFVDSAELWNLLSVTSRLPYKWEDARIPMGKRPAQFPQLEEARGDLDRVLKGKKLRTLLKTKSIFSFCDIMIKEDLSHLSICKFFGDEDALKMIVKARLASYKKSKCMKVTGREEAIISMVKRQM